MFPFDNLPIELSIHNTLPSSSNLRASSEEFMNSYFLKFPEIKDYMQSTIKFSRKSAYVNNKIARRTHIIGINDKSPSKS